jgi:hypothetical protein
MNTKQYVALFVFLLVLQSCTPKLGYQDFVVNRQLPVTLFSQYHIQPDSTAKNRYYIDGKRQGLKVYGLSVDTLWLETNPSKSIEEITIKTETLKRDDFRAFNFEWMTLLDHMGNDFGTPMAGDIRFSNTMIAVWLLQSRIWVYATMEKVYPWQKDQQRYIVIHWRKRVKQSNDIEI